MFMQNYAIKQKFSSKIKKEQIIVQIKLFSLNFIYIYIYIYTGASQ